MLSIRFPIWCKDHSHVLGFQQMERKKEFCFIWNFELMSMGKTLMWIKLATKLYYLNLFQLTVIWLKPQLFRTLISKCPWHHIFLFKIFVNICTKCMWRNYYLTDVRKLWQMWVSYNRVSINANLSASVYQWVNISEKSFEHSLL